MGNGAQYADYVYGLIKHAACKENPLPSRHRARIISSGSSSWIVSAARCSTSVAGVAPQIDSFWFAARTAAHDQRFDDAATELVITSTKPPRVFRHGRVCGEFPQEREGERDRGREEEKGNKLTTARR